MRWRHRAISDYHLMPILDEQWKLDLQSGMSKELEFRGDNSFLWKTNDKNLEINIQHMKAAIERALPLYNKKIEELKKEADQKKEKELQKRKEEAEFRARVEKLLE